MMAVFTKNIATSEEWYSDKERLRAQGIRVIP